MTALRAGIALVVCWVLGWLTVACGLSALWALDGFGSDPSLLAAVGYGLLGLACPVGGLLLTQWLAPRAFGWGLTAYVVGVVSGVVMLGLFA